MSEKWRDRLAIAGIVIFVVLDVVLVAVAVRHAGGDPPRPESAQTVGGTAAGASGDADARQGGQGSPQPGGPAPTAAASSGPADSDRLLLSVAPDQTVLRATRGSCAAGVAPRVEVSEDSGGRFTLEDVPEVSEVLRVRAADADDLSLVGLDPHCRPGRYASTDDGRTWRRTGDASQTWHRAADPEASRVHAPGRTADTPCVPAGLARVSPTVARVLCPSGLVVGTDDAGRSWAALGRLEAAVAVRYSTPAEGYGLAARPGCPAAVLHTADGGASWQRLVCLGEGRPRALGSSAGDGPAESETLAAQVGQDVHVSIDGGSNWGVG